MSKYQTKPRDGFGSLIGSTFAKINAAMVPGRWMSVDAIAKKTGLPKATVANSLHRGRYRKKRIYEYERLIRFKLIKKKK
jgi:hypothetical protein